MSFKKKIYIEKIINWIDSGQLRLTCQICDPGHKTMITLYKKNKNNYDAQFLNNSILNEEIEKIIIKKNKKKGPS